VVRGGGGVRKGGRGSEEEGVGFVCGRLRHTDAGCLVTLEVGVYQRG
jgi:hypothetical protein